MKTYEKPVMEVVELENDVIMTSADQKVYSTSNMTGADGTAATFANYC